MQSVPLRNLDFKPRIIAIVRAARLTAPSFPHLTRPAILALAVLACGAIAYGTSPLFLSDTGKRAVTDATPAYPDSIEIPLLLSSSSPDHLATTPNHLTSDSQQLTATSTPAPELISAIKDDFAQTDHDATGLAQGAGFDQDDVGGTGMALPDDLMFVEAWLPEILEGTLPDIFTVAVTDETTVPLALITLDDDSASGSQPQLPGLTSRIVTINRGDTLSALFQQEKIQASALVAVMRTRHAAHLKTLRPGQKIELLHTSSSPKTDSNTLQQLSMTIDSQRRMIIEADEAGRFASRIEETQLDQAIARVSGKVKNSLYSSMTTAGIPYRMAVELGKILGTVIDFNKDVRAGDRYTLVYETLSRDGKQVGTGRILAAEFSNRGKIYRAVRFENEMGDANYYTPEGKSLKPAFSRYPVKFARISSPFSRARQHPVLGIRRPHLGVDLAAPTGTPIYASGDGQVVHIGTKGGYGRAIILRHGSQYRSLYAHMSRYANGLKQGDRVRHGQVIGYVGSSGISTGPHLHYEFHVNGTPQDPLRVALPGAAPLDKSQLAQFNRQTRTLLAMLDQDDDTMVATSELKETPETLRQQ